MVKAQSFGAISRGGCPSSIILVSWFNNQIIKANGAVAEM